MGGNKIKIWLIKSVNRWLYHFNNTTNIFRHFLCPLLLTALNSHYNVQNPSRGLTVYACIGAVLWISSLVSTIYLDCHGLYWTCSEQILFEVHFDHESTKCTWYWNVSLTSSLIHPYSAAVYMNKQISRRSEIITTTYSAHCENVAESSANTDASC